MSKRPCSDGSTEVRRPYEMVWKLDWKRRTRGMAGFHELPTHLWQREAHWFQVAMKGAGAQSLACQGAGVHAEWTTPAITPVQSGTSLRQRHKCLGEGSGRPAVTPGAGVGSVVSAGVGDSKAARRAGCLKGFSNSRPDPDRRSSLPSWRHQVGRNQVGLTIQSGGVKTQPGAHGANQPICAPTRGRHRINRQVLGDLSLSRRATS